jgi:hypothetical protein
VESAEEGRSPPWPRRRRLRRRLVDQTVTDTIAILKRIETRYSFAPLASRDAASPDMTEALDLQQ